MQYKIMFGLSAIAFVRLGMLGMAEGTPAQTWEMRLWTFVYFAFFVLLYFLSPGERTNAGARASDALMKKTPVLMSVCLILTTSRF